MLSIMSNLLWCIICSLLGAGPTSNILWKFTAALPINSVLRYHPRSFLEEMRQGSILVKIDDTVICRKQNTNLIILARFVWMRCLFWKMRHGVGEHTTS
jgi:hypothetical protein